MLRQLSREWLLFLSFAAVIVLGSLLLLLPISSVAGGMEPLDALFTATSAVCVTGLTVVDTGSFFTPFGQFVVLLLIQAGGLGIITVSSFFAVLLGKRIPLRHEELVRQTHTTLDIRSFIRLIRRIGIFTLCIEAIGAVLLWLAWYDDFPWPRSAALAVFHSVSAFCNAGFSLFPDSLIGYRGDLLVNSTVVMLILLGGIGFLVIYDVERRALMGTRLSLHSRLALLTSLVLVVSGTFLFFLLEQRNVLASMSLADQCLISFFQAVTPRTAGFNTVDFGHLTNSTIVLTMILMFIGGSPGSTAGGIKTTTLAVFLSLAISRVRGRNTANAFRRTIPEKIVNEMLAIILVSIGILIVFNFTLQWSETGALPHQEAAGKYIELTFESVSAFGTVGLSTGITPRLTAWGKIQVILLMLIGRVGPLAIAVGVAKRQREALEYEYYRENVMVG